MPLATFVNAADLETWADRLDAQSLLPLLVRRLILATSDRITRIGFRAGEGVQLPGWDGTVVAETGNAFVPEGNSAWELGSGQDVRRKGDDDYRKRTRIRVALIQLMLRLSSSHHGAGQEKRHGRLSAKRRKYGAMFEYTTATTWRHG